MLIRFESIWNISMVSDKSQFPYTKKCENKSSVPSVPMKKVY